VQWGKFTASIEVDVTTDEEPEIKIFSRYFLRINKGCFR